MKAIPLLISCIAMVSATAMAKDTTAKSDADVKVEFVKPEDFTDFATTSQGSKKDRDALMSEFREDIQRVAGRYLSNGYHLDLKFHDINMAGDFEPQLGPQFNDVRIMKAIYPPSIVVEYTLTNSKGETVASGRRRETDLAFQQIVTFRTDDHLFYVTELVINLLREITSST